MGQLRAMSQSMCTLTRHPRARSPLMSTIYSRRMRLLIWLKSYASTCAHCMSSAMSGSAIWSRSSGGAISALMSRSPPTCHSWPWAKVPGSHASTTLAGSLSLSTNSGAYLEIVSVRRRTQSAATLKTHARQRHSTMGLPMGRALPSSSNSSS